VFDVLDVFDGAYCYGNGNLDLKLSQFIGSQTYNVATAMRRQYQEIPLHSLMRTPSALFHSASRQTRTEIFV